MENPEKLMFFGIPLEPSVLEQNMPWDGLRIRALKKGAQKTSNGRIVLAPKIKSRLEPLTEINFGNPTPEQEAEIREAFGIMRGKRMLRQIRRMGRKLQYDCELIVSSEHPEPTLVWSSLLDEPGIDKKPVFVTVSIPEFPRQHVYVFPDHNPPLEILLGVDYGGEHKMAFLKQFLYQVKKERLGLGLHGSLVKFNLKTAQGFTLQNGNPELVPHYVMFLAGSGTGKTTCSSGSYDLGWGESSRFMQDDIVAWLWDGSVRGTEQLGYYVIVSGMREGGGQDNIWQAIQSKRTVLENVVVKDGEPDFCDLSLSKNPRAAIPVSAVPGATTEIDAPRLDHIFLVMRGFDIFPPIMRLSPERAAYEFMMGRTVETAAGDPSKINAGRNIVGWNPFIMGQGTKAEAQAFEGNMFFDLLRANRHANVFLLNTGSVGGPKSDDHPGSISILDTMTLIEKAIRGEITWMPSLFGEGYDEPDYLSLGLGYLDPHHYYDTEEFLERVDALRKADAKWLKQFEDHLNPEVRSLVVF